MAFTEQGNMQFKCKNHACMFKCHLILYLFGKYCFKGCLSPQLLAFNIMSFDFQKKIDT